MLSDLGTGGVSGLNVRQILRRPAEPLQVLNIDHRSHAAAPAGEEHGLMARAGVVDNIVESATRNRDRQVRHALQYG